MLDNNLVTYASTLLQDNADTWWRHMETAQDENGLPLKPTSWSTFKTEFHKDFKPDNATQMARARLQKLKQTGTIHDYIIDFRNIMLDLPDMFEADAVYQFIQGLEYEARLQRNMLKIAKKENFTDGLIESAIICVLDISGCMTSYSAFLE